MKKINCLILTGLAFAIATLHVVGSADAALASTLFRGKEQELFSSVTGCFSSNEQERASLMLKIESLLNSSDVNINAKNQEEDLTILHLAVENGEYELICYLLSKNANPNVMGRDNISPLAQVKCLNFAIL